MVVISAKAPPHRPRGRHLVLQAQATSHLRQLPIRANPFGVGPKVESYLFSESGLARKPAPYEDSPQSLDTIRRSVRTGPAPSPKMTTRLTLEFRGISDSGSVSGNRANQVLAARSSPHFPGRLGYFRIRGVFGSFFALFAGM